MKKVLVLMLMVLLLLSGITAVAADYEYTVNGIGISDDTGAVYSQIPYGSDVNITVSITKNVYSSEIPTVILTSYKNTGELYQTKMFKLENVQAMQTVKLTAAMEAIQGGNLKAFVWESVNNPVPRSNSITKKFSEYYIEIPNNDTSSTRIVRGIVTEEGDGYIIINATERFDETTDSWTEYGDSLTIAKGKEFDGLLQYGIEAVISGYPTKPVLESVNTEYVHKYNKTANLSSEDILNIAEDKIDLISGESYGINLEKLYINGELSDEDVSAAIAGGNSVLLLCNNGSGIYNIAFVTEEEQLSLLAAGDKQYYNIEDICFENQDGSSVTALTPGEEIYIGAAITRIDSTANTAPEIVLNMRDADGAVTETVIFSMDKFRYNDTVIISGLFTVPENAEDSVITANVYDSIVTKNSLAEQFVKNLSDFNIVNEIKGNIISLRGTFNSQTNGVAAFTVKEALVNINGTKIWTTDFTDYVAENININLNNVDISDMTSGEALLEVSVKNGIITLISAEKLGGSVTEPGIKFISEDIDEYRTDLNRVVTADGKYKLAVRELYINGKTEVAYERVTGIPVGTDTANYINELLDYYFTNDAAVDIRLVSSRDSDVYDVVYITDYQDYIVDSITAERYYFVAADSRKIVLDEENPNYSFEIIKDGKKISFADIKSGDVVSIAGGFDIINSKEVAYGKVYVTTEKAEGIIKTYDTEYYKITVGDTEYRYNPNYLVPGVDFRLGDETVMYLNARGVIVGVDFDAVNDALRAKIKYGFATIMGRDTGIDNTMQIRLLKTDGEWETMNFANKLTINEASPIGISNISNSKWLTYVGNTGVDGNASSVTDSGIILVNKVVGYETESNGNINKIYFTANAYSELYNTVANTENSTYSMRTETFGKVLVNKNTVIFSVSGDMNGRLYDDDVNVGGIDGLTDGEVYGQSMAVNVDEDGYATVIYGANLVKEIYKVSQGFTIADSSLTTSDEGEEGTLLKGINGGEEVKIFPDDTDKGDVILYNKGDVKTVIKILGDFD